MKLLSKIAFLLIMGLLTFSSCKKDDDTPPNEEELITTMIMTWTPEGGGTPVIFSFRDLDGDGGNPPVITTAPLAANTTYDVEITVADESKTPAGDITEEILEEAAEHQFFFRVTEGITLTFSYEDTDSNGNPIGLKTKMITSAPSLGILRVTLRHEPNKTATDVAMGKIDNAGGETDIEVDFDFVVQ